MERQKEASVETQTLGGDTIVEQGSYNLIADTNGDFKITHLVLKAENGSKRVWRVAELTEKDVSFKIEKFA
ncbi:MAG: hypothetical protein AABX12_04795 [Nanoarchaeota archaeon]